MLKRKLLFHGIETTGWLLLTAVVVVIACVLIWTLLRYERRLVRKRVGNTLLVLRIAVLAVLFLTLLQPVIAWTLDRERTGRIVVAVDLSESMGTSDTHAGRGEKLRWARAMGMIGNEMTNDRLDRWIEDYKQGREPQWVSEAEEPDAQRRRRLAEARKKNLQGIFEEVDRLPRKEIARRLLTGTSSPLLPMLSETADVELVAFAGKSESLDVEALNAIVESPPDGLLTGVSDLSAALSRRSGGSAAAPVIGVVVLTDGRDNSRHDAVAQAARLGQTSTPVFPVIFGSRYRPKDLAIASLDYPERPYKGDKPLLTATLNTSGFSGQQIEVVLEREGSDPQRKTITPAGTSAGVTFKLDAEQVGRHEYTVRTDVRPGETRDDNNSKTFAITVVDEKADVLIAEGEARWEFRFIDNALRRDDRVEADRVVFRQPYLGVLADTFFPRSLDVPADSDDLASSPFAESDLVIIGDVAPGDITRTGWELLQKFVSESGGTLVLTAGKQHFPLSYDSPILNELIPMVRLRPVHIDERAAIAAPAERGFRLKLTPEGENESMFQFDADPQRNRAIWTGLPGHLWGLLGEAKPGADVFAYAVQPGQQDNMQTQRKNAVIVRQIYGAGQVLWIGIDSTWRWRHRVGDQYHHRFWGQLCRWAVENKLSAGNEFVRFGPDRSDIEEGDDVMIRARWSQRFLKRNRDVSARAQIFRADREEATLPFAELELQPVDTRPLVHEARAVALPAGQYRIKLVAENADLGPDEVSALLYVNEKATTELNDVSSNRDLLRQMAEVSGGRLFEPDEVGRLPEELRSPVIHSRLRREIELWDHWLVMLAFFFLLTTEWVVRKLNGLP